MNRGPPTLLRRFFAVAASAVECQAHPEKFNGVFTKFGWVLVPKTHVARGWTQSRLNEFLEQKLPAQEGKTAAKFDEIQKFVDEWAADVSLKEKPAVKKKSAADVKHEENLKLFLQQLREEVKKGDKKKVRTTRVKKNVTNGDVTFTHAWNYFMTKQYSQFKLLPEAEARAKVGLMWRLMSMDEKDVYREEYSQLLQLGKDIYHGKIVDREVKMKAVERLNLSKERSLAKKLKKLEETQKEMAAERAETEKLEGEK